jgi:23S rRNA (adenine2030-N6)-methyltransferase
LYELHPADFAALSRNIRDKRVRAAREDGLGALRALLPPAPKRALVLIDPSYEVKSDYRQVVATLREALQRFPTGIYTLWYPLLELPAARELPDALRKLGARDWLDARLQVREPGPGMYGSGMFVINPPYTLPETLEPALDLLVQLLGQDAAADRQLEWNIV